jgi:hypothetical protein
MKLVGKPDAGNRHVRFDERGQETECCHMAQATAPVLDSTGRREFITLLCGAVASPLAARAQQAASSRPSAIWGPPQHPPGPRGPPLLFSGCANSAESKGASRQSKRKSGATGRQRHRPGDALAGKRLVLLREVVPGWRSWPMLIYLRRDEEGRFRRRAADPISCAKRPQPIDHDLHTCRRRRHAHGWAKRPRLPLTDRRQFHILRCGTARNGRWAPLVVGHAI